MVEIKENQPRYELKEEPKKFKEFEKWQLKIYDDWLIGSGSYGKVFIGSYKKPENYVAVNVIRKENSQIKTVSNETICLNYLSHPNIVSIYTCFQTGTNYYLIRELCRNGTLKDYLMRQLASQKLYYKIIHDILEGFRYANQKNIVHGNLNPYQILIDEKGNAKIKGLGLETDGCGNCALSGIVETKKFHDSLETLIIKDFYTSIDIILKELEDKPCSSKCDIFSLGVLIFEMIYGGHPYLLKKNENTYQILKKYKQRPSLNFPPDPPSMKVSEELKQLLTGMLKIEEKDRLSWKDVFEQFEKEYNKSNFIKIDYSLCRLINKRDLKDESYIRAKYDASQLRLIGKGGCGKVFLAVRNGANEKIALKVIESNSTDELNDSLNELVNLSKLEGHPNIMSLIGYRVNPVILEDKSLLSQLFIEMPLATNNLGNILKTEIKSGMSEDTIISFYSQISFALMFAHNKNMAHLDLKPNNILTIGQIFCIADWGGSLRIKSGKTTTFKSQNFGFTRGYAAPELDALKTDDKINFFLCDIYSLAIVLLRLCGISKLEIDEIPKTKKYHDKHLEDDILSKLHNKYSATLIGSIKKMAAFEPKERPSLEETRKNLLIV